MCYNFVICEVVCIYLVCIAGKANCGGCGKMADDTDEVRIMSDNRDESAGPTTPGSTTPGPTTPGRSTPAPGPSAPASSEGATTPKAKRPLTEIWKHFKRKLSDPKMVICDHCDKEVS